MTIDGKNSYALWCTAVGETEIRPTPTSSQAGEELVEVVACDVSPLDRQVAEGRYPLASPFPVIPGTSGVVRDSDGKLYFAFVEMRGGGLTTPGIHRTVASVPKDVLFPIPNEVNPLHVAAGFTGLITALAILDHTIHIEVGQSVLILGANRGVGAAAVAVAKDRGAHVIAAAREEISIPGVDYVSYDEMPGKVMDITQGKGVSAIIDGLGGEITNKALLCGGIDCKHILLGFSAGHKMPLLAPRFLGTEHQLIGYNLFRRPWSLIETLMAQSMDYLKDGKAIPVIAQQLPFAQAGEAFRSAASKRGRTLIMMEGYAHGGH